LTPRRHLSQQKYAFKRKRALLGFHGRTKFIREQFKESPVVTDGLTNFGETSPDSFCGRRACDLIEDGLKAASQGLSDRAIRRFKDSLRLRRTADALTYWAWVESSKGNLQVAAHLCREALRVDDDFGNAANDLGSYLAALGDTRTAIEWFEKAKKSERYSSRHFPYMNLGRIYLEQGEYWKAFKEYREAQKICPDDESIRAAISKLEAHIL
jgi:tetratricopeptide (TPR) repeat protein